MKSIMPVKLKKLWILILMAALALPAPAMAAGNIRFGALEVYPYFFLKQQYSDNIFAVAQNAKSDWITTFTPGIRLVLPIRRHMFTMEYNAVINAHSNYSSEDTTDQNARIMADLKLGGLLGIKASHTYAKGHEPRAVAAIGQIEKFERNAPSITATYQLADRSKIQLDYTRTRWDFTPSRFRTRDEDLISAYFYYRFLPKTSVFVEYDWRNISYDLKINHLDSRAHGGFLGLTWEVTATTLSTIKAGYLQKNFEAGGMKDYSTWGMSADINHVFSDYASLKLIAMREINETPVLGARYFVTTGAFAEYTYRFSRKISNVFRLSYGEDDYSDVIPPATQTRSDRTFLGGVGLKYQMRDWVEFVLEYQHRNRDSNIPLYDLRQNVISLAINLTL